MTLCPRLVHDRRTSRDENMTLLVSSEGALLPVTVRGRIYLLGEKDGGEKWILGEFEEETELWNIQDVQIWPTEE